MESRDIAIVTGGFFKGYTVILIEKSKEHPSHWKCISTFDNLPVFIPESDLRIIGKSL
jgi:hypothetical protein